ncbi:MAG TPA: hypothetical protein DCS93_40355 [Microscillaceae bacterium]|nr:hypothetical protein [Microscillaceae bacterium]
MKRIIKIVSISTLLLLTLLAGAFLYSRPWKNALFISPLYQLNTSQKVIALTFDDGPSDARTPALLDLLKQKQVLVTFFMLGRNIKKHPNIAQRVYQEGHLIGNHSYSHPRMILKSPGFLKSEILRTEQLIQSLGQQEVKYFRPPYSSKFIVLPLVLSSLDKVLVTGTYDPPAEYGSPYKAQKVAKQVVQNAQPGSIIYLHDGKKSDPAAFVKSVEIIIDQLHAQGYRFVRLDQIK